MEKPDPAGTPPRDRPQSIAHLAETVLNSAGHVVTHVAATGDAIDAGDLDRARFDNAHASRHAAVLVEHQRKLIAHLQAHVPGVRDELGRLTKITDPASTAPVPHRSAAAQRAYEETRAAFAASAGSKWEQ